MPGTNEPNNAGGSGLKGRLLKGLRAVKRLLRLPMRLDRFVEGAAPFHATVEEQQRQYQTLRDGNVALSRMLAELLPKLQQDVQAGRSEIAQLANQALPEMHAAASASREEVGRLKRRYAEYYGALVEQLRAQNRRLDELAAQQDHILRTLVNPSDVLQLDQNATRLPQAG